MRAQKAVRLDQWPARLQLYPRNQLSQCSVAISGQAPDDDVKAISLVVARDNKPYQYRKIIPDSLTGHFAFAPVIKAELNQYSFQLFIHRVLQADSVRVAFRDSIVCGDVFLIMGQSNAVGQYEDYTIRSTFCRTFGVHNFNNSYNPADTAWCLTNTKEDLTCLWGMELQRMIKEKQGIPTAIINGAVGGTTITSHANRDASQPMSLSTLYGRLLYRASKAGVASQAKAMIWRQGEAEAANNPDVYVRTFPQLYNYWKLDYPGLRKIYHSQINILTDNVINAGVLRDFQRRSKSIFADNEPIATVGLPGYEGVHYDEAGHYQFGLELYRLIARDLYGVVDTAGIGSPNLQKLYYSKPEQDEITLEFEPVHKMSWPADTIISSKGYRYAKSLSDFIYTDYPTGESGLVKSVAERGNSLVIKLTKRITAKHLTYLPSSYQDNQVGFYVGPVIRNKLGMRALSFYQVPIAPALPAATNFLAVPVDTSAIELSWDNKIDSLARWSIERADTNGIFKQIAVLSGTSQTYQDLRSSDTKSSLKIGEIYQYRIRSVSPQSASDYSPIVTASLKVVLDAKLLPQLEVESTLVGIALGTLLYPNPADDEVSVRLPLEWSGDVIQLTLTDPAGKVILQRNHQMSLGATSLIFSVAALPSGVYIVSLGYGKGGIRCRLVVAH
ncbi:sialate O-acetylesterase [Spirosoma fluviale]|uniref:Por secretion system C-terminal sorting domain-containing protein n=1 Tax=Spirosoma fluviale TaxID=1597977 RepID=A0A286F962_9BACT|nr:sialate O-acetylesterase [Spirosoma fluviale]SOD79732.1 Por secretion system C-terminal sorting domain-containing protein [Spirosoma fluviale]